MNVASKNLGIPVRYLREFKPLGTGGGLYFFRDVLTRDKPDCILVLHADICADFRLEGTPLCSRESIGTVPAHTPYASLQGRLVFLIRPGACVSLPWE